MINIVKELNSEQAAAAANIDGPSLIIAGAGSGKTRMLTYKIAHMMQEGIKEYNILALTFTNKAAKEMSERINQLVNRDLKDLTATTFHSFGLLLLKKYIHHLGYTSNFTIYDTIDNQSLLANVITDLNYKLADFNLRTLLTYFSDIKNKRQLEPDDKTSAVYEIFTRFMRAQKTYNVVDFDDLITLPVKLFKEHPEVLEEVQERYRYILVDEFQDTSIMQYDFIAMIAKKYGNIAVVGDDDQSIYSWRGANYENLLLFEKDFPTLKEYKLQFNYRSSGNILNAANKLILNNKNRKEKTLQTNQGAGSIISYLEAINEEDEACKFTKSIKDIKSQEGLKYSDFAILVRTNALMNNLETNLLANGIQVKISGGKSFFDKKEIRDIMSYIKLTLNTKDNTSLLRIINTPRRGIGLTTIEKLKKYAAEYRCSLYTAIIKFAHSHDAPISEKVRESLLKFHSLVEELEYSSTTSDAASFINHLIDITSYREMLEEDYEDEILKYKLQSLSYLTDRARRLSSESNIRQFLNLISLDGKDDTDEDSSKVNLVTMHASKGLEYHTVYLAGIENNIIPSPRALEERMENIEEERRLFYVAITRAKVNLLISRCKERRKWNGEVYETEDSVFLAELPKELLNFNAKADLAMTMDDKNAKLQAFLNRLKK